MAIGKAIQSLVAGEQVAGSKIGGKLLDFLQTGTKTIVYLKWRTQKRVLLWPTKRVIRSW